MCPGHHPFDCLGKAMKEAFDRYVEQTATFTKDVNSIYETIQWWEICERLAGMAIEADSSKLVK